MAARRNSGGKKRKQTGGPAVPWVLYPLAVMVGTTAGVLYYFNSQPTPPPAPANPPPARVTSALVQHADEPARPRRRPRQVDELPPDEPAVTVRTVPAHPKPATPAAGESAPTAATVTPSPAAGTVSPLPPTEIERGAGHRPEVALTFDAGSDWRPVKKILETLEAHQAKATFFLTGEWVEKNPKTTQLIAAAGHEFGNHSWNHPAFTHLPDSEIRDQVRRTDAKITEVTGKSSHPYFRPPLGDRDARVRRLIGDEGFLTIYWSLDSRDSVDKGITADTIRERVLGKSKAGSIVLLHCGSQASADALSGILDGLETKGLTQVPLSRLLQE